MIFTCHHDRHDRSCAKAWLGGPQGTVSDQHRTLCWVPFGMSPKWKELVVKSENKSSRRGRKNTWFEFFYTTGHHSSTMPIDDTLSMMGVKFLNHPLRFAIHFFYICLVCGMRDHNNVMNDSNLLKKIRNSSQTGKGIWSTYTFKWRYLSFLVFFGEALYLKETRENVILVNLRSFVTELISRKRKKIKNMFFYSN